ncbi:uncharacterized protein TNIN_373671 [Trichonephila inaurata madagascariensis]|uniref:Uncharacterized protein n=2 Tax=Trichonephila inaurata madagascariensis TaxID=2747483 RepID=A0A8X6X9A2_9ARAC|nr:uncharacterized protein TNIN_373671 [Trichonephila inaurata madagascariensis]
MKSLDQSLSFSVFIIVLSGMSGLFFINFAIAFIPKEGYLHYLSDAVGEIYFLALIGMVILPAARVNSSSMAEKEAVLSLPGKIPKHYKELKIMVTSECMKDVSLTLWKTYKIERSILISASGTLITYGILLATLSGYG